MPKIEILINALLRKNIEVSIQIVESPFINIVELDNDFIYFFFFY